MTREEAIDLLDNLIGFVEDNHDSDYDMALKMAIEALKQEPSNVMEHDKDHIWYKGKQYISLSRFLQVKEPCEDAISRQAVLDLIEHYNSDGLGALFYGYDEGLKFTKAVNKLPSVNPQEPKYCDRNICIKNEYNGIGCDECEVTKSQEPRKGHWIEVTNGRGGHECDVCHDYAPSFQNGNEYLSAFCPNCGAKMEESEDKE